MQRSALIVPVAEAEPYVGRWRDAHDPAARLGVPAHVTLLFPFMPPHDIDAPVLEQLRALVASCAAFGFRLGGPQRFATALYLAPQPAAPFVELTMRLGRASRASRPTAARMPTSSRT